MIFAWIRFIIAALFILVGLFVVVSAMIGVFRFNFVLNRMQISASIDTMGIFLVLLGLLILNGFDASSLKLILIIVFFWISGPACSHLISKAEVETNDEIEKECELPEGGLGLHYENVEE